jgi:hypothetical protein
MAQAIRNKDVRKNCVDVEKVVMECLEEPERDNIHTIVDQIELKRFDYAKFHQEYIPINRVKQQLVYKNYGVY